MRVTGLRQSLEGIKALASLGGGAVMLWIVYEFAGVLLDQAAAKAPGGYGGTIANQWLNTGLDVVLPATFLGLMFFGLVAQAVLQRRYP